MSEKRRCLGPETNQGGLPVVTRGLQMCTAKASIEGPAPTGLIMHPATPSPSCTDVTTALPPGCPGEKAKQGTWTGRGGRGWRPDSLLPSFPDHGDPLTVFCPSNVLDLPSEGLVLILQQVLFLRGVPDPQLPRHVCGHNGVVRATLTSGPGLRGLRAHHVALPAVPRLVGWPEAQSSIR